MIDRIIRDIVLERSRSFPVVAITGPRQSGKTTLSKMIFPEKEYVLLDDEVMKAMALSSPQDFLKAFPNGVVIDETQKVKEIFTAVKYYVDKDPYVCGKFILTGSSSFDLRKNMSDSLAGRLSYVHLLPITLFEVYPKEKK